MKIDKKRLFVGIKSEKKFVTNQFCVCFIEIAATQSDATFWNRTKFCYNKIELVLNHEKSVKFYYLSKMFVTNSSENFKNKNEFDCWPSPESFDKRGYQNVSKC